MMLSKSLALSGQQSVHADIIALLRERAMEEEGTRLAFVFLGDGETETARLTFGELDWRARAIAVRLLEVTRSGERALLLYPPGLDFITAFFGCLYAGIVAVPANPPSRQHLHRLRSVVEDAVPAIVMTTIELREQFETRSAKSWPRDKLLWLVTEGCQLTAADRWMRPVINAESVAFLQYTSGSTGAPKGVMVSHGNLLSNEAVIKSAFGHDRHSTVVGWLPLYHDMGLIGNILQPLYVGSTAILMPPFAFLEKPLRWLRAIAKYKARTSGGPNFAYELCLRQVSAADKHDLDLSSWTLAFNGSETVRASTLNRFAAAFAECGFRHEAFFPCYGLAEATLFVSGANRGRGLIVKRFNKAALSQGLAIAEIDSLDENEGIVACGHGGSGHHLKIVDPETRNICPDGRIGEIWFAGPSVAQGYWGQPGETEHIFRARTAGREEKPYLRTGDLGFVDGGQLFIAGRIKDLIIIRGANYYASDFERILDQGVPGLRAGCNTAFAVERENQEVLILVAEAKRDYLRINGAATIFQAVRAVIAREYPLAIGEIVLVPPGAVPKTSSGKIRRRACRQAYLDGVLRILAVNGEEMMDSREPVREMRQAFVTPSGSTEEESRTVSDVLHFLCLKIARILRCSESEIQTEKSLAELGLNSLQTVGLKHGVDAFLEIDLPLHLLLAENSLSTLAKEIAALPPTTRLQVSSSATGLSYTQRALWTVHRLDQNSISYNLHLALDIAGELDTETLSTALAYILQRHEQLRTSYRDDNGRLGQAVEPFAKLTEWFSLVDASSWNGATLQADIGARTRQHFDLERGLPLRVTLYRQGHNKTTLLFCAHHIAIDLWSLLLLIQEIEESYRDLQSGLACKTTPAPRYADFIVWQNNYLESSLATRDFEYWKTQLDRQLPILALPTDFPRPSGSDYCGASHALRLDPDFTASLKALASHHGVSFSTLLLAIYQVLLHRYSGQCEMVVGVPGSGRLRGEFARLVGNCVNPIAIVGRLLPALSFTEFLRQLGERVRDGLVHQKFPVSYSGGAAAPGAAV